MIISNVSHGYITLHQALQNVNKQFDDNIVFLECEPTSRTKKRWKVRLKTLSYDKPGYRRTHLGRRHPSACWHVHGYFFEELLILEPKARIYSASKKIYALPEHRVTELPDRLTVWHEHLKDGYIQVGNWVDRNIGSVIQPLYFSEACDC